MRDKILAKRDRRLDKLDQYARTLMQSGESDFPQSPRRVPGKKSLSGGKNVALSYVNPA